MLSFASGNGHTRFVQTRSTYNDVYLIKLVTNLVVRMMEHPDTSYYAAYGSP